MGRKHIRQRCIFEKAPGYTCGGHIAGRRPPLCKRHYMTGSRAVREGKYSSIFRIPSEFFSDQAIEKRRYEGPRTIRAKLGRCPFKGRAGYRCVDAMTSSGWCHRHYWIGIRAVRKGIFKSLEAIPPEWLTEKAFQARQKYECRFYKRKGYTCEGRENCSNHLCKKHYMLSWRAVRKGLYPSLEEVPEDYLLDTAIAKRRARRICMFQDRPGYTCAKGKVYKADPDLCARHYHAWKLANEYGHRVFEEIPESFFSDKAIVERLQEANVRAKRTFRKRYGNQDVKCRFDGRSGYVCKYHYQRGSSRSKLLTHVGDIVLCTRHGGMYKHHKPTKMPPDRWFSEAGRAILRKQSYKKRARVKRSRLTNLANPRLARS